MKRKNEATLPLLDAAATFRQTSVRVFDPGTLRHFVLSLGVHASKRARVSRTVGPTVSPTPLASCCAARNASQTGVSGVPSRLCVLPSRSQRRTARRLCDAVGTQQAQRSETRSGRRSCGCAVGPADVPAALARVRCRLAPDGSLQRVASTDGLDELVQLG